jgi:hypothetical protein
MVRCRSNLDHSPQDGFADTVIGSLFSPANRVGYYIGGLIFPNSAVRGTTGWYLVPLFSTVAQIAILSLIW